MKLKWNWNENIKTGDILAGDWTLSSFIIWIQAMSTLWPNGSRYLSYRNPCMWAKSDQLKEDTKGILTISRRDTAKTGGRKAVCCQPSGTLEWTELQTATWGESCRPQGSVAPPVWTPPTCADRRNKGQTCWKGHRQTLATGALWSAPAHWRYKDPGQSPRAK